MLALLLLPACAYAYTLVMRGGRRVEIPDRFTVTKLTITYETAPGINVTVLISAVDVEATERANSEPAGSLLRRAEATAQARPASPTSRRPRRELTQADVEAARLARARSEQEYERRRVELGLPSLEEARRRNEEDIRRMTQESRTAAAEGAQAESYWRSRASALREEMAAVDAQIQYFQKRLAETPEHTGIIGYPLTGYPFGIGLPPIYTRGRAGTSFPVVTGNPGFMRAPGTSGAQTAGFAAFGAFGATHGQVPPVGVRRPYPSRTDGHRPGRGAPPLFIYGTGQDYSNDRTALISRLQELEAARSALQVRWRLLEEEARRAGAMPGWLR